MATTSNATEDFGVIDQSVAKVHRLIDGLVATLERENHFLASGLPASLTSTLGEKMHLAGEIEAEMKALVSTKEINDLSKADKLFLVERVQLTHKLASENARRLAVAISASQRRIDAIMSAIRDEQSSATPAYGANGRRQKAQGRGVSHGFVL